MTPGPGPRLMLLTGAPPASAVDAASCTVDRFEEPFASLLGLRSASGVADAADAPSQPAAAVAWRVLPPAGRPLPLAAAAAAAVEAYGFGSSLDGGGGGAAFLSTADLPSSGGCEDGGEGAEAAWTQFCEQSLALDDSAASPRPDDDSLFLDDDTSLVTTASSASAMPPPPPPPALPLTELARVPPAGRIAALQPQTVTVNVVVAVVSVAAPRAVTTRWGRPASLVEVVVGDDTAAGFAVTFWLAGGRADDDGGGGVAALRRQDVVLLENVALHVFRGRVYGQSLRRGLTRVSLLWKAGGGGCFSARRLEAPGEARHPLRERARLVKDWVLHFVGRDAAGAARRGRGSWDRPPDDTQCMGVFSF